ncbi:MAG: L,D-transpeptidase [Pyrinomonadaceae bacterium]|nr:L,D-transpeptidase [Pyrinomonadaceae bacterium]
MKKLIISLIIFVVLLTAFYVSGHFFVMPFENSALPDLQNPRLVIKKAQRELLVFDGEEHVKTYSIVLGFSPTGDKDIEGDGRTPEGEFYIFTKNDQSRFFLSLGVSYPSIEDAKRGLAENLISQQEHDQIIDAISEKKMPLQKTKLGGEIYIHGGGIIADWTDGCIALRNEEIQQLFNVIPVGTPVIIQP